MTEKDHSDQTKVWVDQGKDLTYTSTETTFDISEELYRAIVAACSAWKSSCPDQDDHILQTITTKLSLFGADYPYGQLSFLLLHADELRNTVTGLLIRIGSILCHSLFTGKHRPNLTAPVLSEASELSTVNKSPTSHSTAVNSSDNLERLVEDVNFLIERAALILPPSSGGQDEDLISLVSDDDDEEPLDALNSLLGCLMDLLPALEENYAQIQLPQIKHTSQSAPVFSVSSAALPFVRNIAEKFREADHSLVERLGEANWQRFVRIRAWMDDSPRFTRDLPLREVFEEDAAPMSLFEPQSLFRDSALGSSIISKSRDDLSVVSHTSFASSVNKDGQALRVPKTPAAIDNGKPFTCQFCGRIQKKIRNRIDWKIHVFEDLRPYICTARSCNDYLIAFANRAEWASHEFSKHRLIKTWWCPECSFNAREADLLASHVRRNHAITLEASISAIVSACVNTSPAPIEDQTCHICLERPGKSRRNFVKHVAKHLESIALAVLPREAEDSESGSEDESHERDSTNEPSLPEPTPFSNPEVPSLTTNSGKVKLGLKNKECPFCGDHFTSSSLDWHLDLYIKDKNPKKYDGVHDVEEIRRLRASVTRSQPRSTQHSAIIERLTNTDSKLDGNNHAEIIHNAKSYRVDACPPGSKGPPPSPPDTLLQNLSLLQAKYPNDRVEGVMRYTAVSEDTDEPIIVKPDAPPPPNTKYCYYLRIGCKDCPGKLYYPDPDLGVNNFEVHLKNRHHRDRVQQRVNEDSVE